MTQNNPDINELFVELGVSDSDYTRAEVEKYLSVVDEPFIKDYLDRTHGPTHEYRLKIVKVFEITRPQCRKNYRSDLTNKRLLWHGTPEQNVYSILRDGFNLAWAGYDAMFGPVRKLYQRSYIGYIFLSEVALGKMKICLDYDYYAHIKLDKVNSVFGKGSYGCSQEGRVVAEDVVICPGLLRYFQNRQLQYNEYVVYNTNQIQLKYLVKVRFGPPNTFSPLYYFAASIGFIISVNILRMCLIAVGRLNLSKSCMVVSQKLITMGMKACSSLCDGTYELISKPIKSMGLAASNLLS